MSQKKKKASSNAREFSTLVQRRGTRNMKHKKLSSLSQRTWHVLGSENLKDAIKCPPAEDMNEWIAANTFDFLNEVNILWGNCIDPEAHSRYMEPGSGFPKGVTYRWSNDKDNLTAPEYVEIALIWVDDQCSNTDIFPDTEKESVKYPEDFVETYVKEIFKKLFRVFAIFYWSYTDDMGENVAHLNTCFRHYVYFALHHGLLPGKLEFLKTVVKIKSIPELMVLRTDEKEIQPIENLVTRLKGDFARKTVVPSKNDK